MIGRLNTWSIGIVIVIVIVIVIAIIIVVIVIVIIIFDVIIASTIARQRRGYVQKQ